MKKTKRFVLFLILSAFSTIVCRCSLDNGTDAFLSLSDGSMLKCRAFGENYLLFTGGGPEITYDCQITCPDGRTVLAERLDPNVKLSLQDVHEQFCGVPKKPRTATPTPTSISSITPSPAPATALLSGVVTACDYKSLYINFTLANPTRLPPSASIKVFINGTPVSCSVPNNNPNVLSCVLPTNVTPPIKVVAEVNGVQVNSFVYSGYCNFPNPNQPKADPVQPTVVPSPTDFGG